MSDNLSPHTWSSYPAKAVSSTRRLSAPVLVSGILGHPLEPVIGRRFAPTRWRVTTPFEELGHPF
jgi:hypothetical protein